MLKAVHIPPYFQSFRAAKMHAGHPAIGLTAQRRTPPSQSSTAVILWTPPAFPRHASAPLSQSATGAMMKPAAPVNDVALAAPVNEVMLAPPLPQTVLAQPCSPPRKRVMFAPLPDMKALRAADAKPKQAAKSCLPKQTQSLWSATYQAVRAIFAQLSKVTSSMWQGMASLFKRLCYL